MPRQHPLIVLIQGPRPWWAPLLLILSGLAAMIFLEPLIASPLDTAVMLASLACFLLGGTWVFMRQAENAYYKQVKTNLVASGGRLFACPVCKYDLGGTPVDETEGIPPTCPECGEDLIAFRRELVSGKT